MARVVKMCDMPVSIAARVFMSLNPEIVKVRRHKVFLQLTIVTDVEPKELTYPEGWYYAKGRFRNKHTSSTGAYSEIVMRKSDGTLWGDLAKYCTPE